MAVLGESVHCVCHLTFLTFKSGSLEFLGCERAQETLRARKESQPTDTCILAYDTSSQTTLEFIDILLMSS